MSTPLTRRDQLQAHQIIRDLAPRLVDRGTLRGNAAEQMCDGFVSPQNLRQAEDAMIRARNAGDGRAFEAAKVLHNALNVAMAFQDPRETLVENRGDKLNDLYNGGSARPFGSGIGTGDADYGGTPNSGREPTTTEALIGVGLVAAFALMARKQHRHQRDDVYRR